MTQHGLLFDMDGVLVANHEYHYKAWQELAGQHNITIDEVFYREKMNGRTLIELMKVVFQEEMPIDEAKKIGNIKEEIYRDLYREHRQATPGLIAFLEEAKSRDIPMVVGTSAPRENVEFTLDGLDLRKYFVGVVDDRMVTKGKPHPEVYLNCAKMIDRDPKKCIVFEDALSGLEAGSQAGAKLIALATSHERHELHGDLIIDDFTQLTIADIERIWAL